MDRTPFQPFCSHSKLSEEQKQSCEGEISLEEIKLILDSFQNNKSPGSDGILQNLLEPDQ